MPRHRKSLKSEIAKLKAKQEREQVQRESVVSVSQTEHLLKSDDSTPSKTSVESFVKVTAEHAAPIDRGRMISRLARLEKHWNDAERGTFETCIADVRRWLFFLGQHIGGRIEYSKRLKRIEEAHKDPTQITAIEKLQASLDAVKISHYERFCVLTLDQCLLLQRQLQSLQAMYASLCCLARAAHNQLHTLEELDAAYRSVFEQITILYGVLFVPPPPALVRNAKQSAASGCCDGKDVKVVKNVKDVQDNKHEECGLCVKAGLWSAASLSEKESGEDSKHSSFRAMTEIATPVYNVNNEVMAYADDRGVWINPFAELKFKTLDEFLSADGGVAALNHSAEQCTEQYQQFTLEQLALDAMHASYLYRGYDENETNVWWDSACKLGYLMVSPQEIQEIQSAIYHYTKSAR